MVARSATRNLGRKLIQQIGVGLRIDLALEQARGALYGELADLLAQAFARARGFARDLVASLSHQALRFERSRALGFVDDLVRALAGLFDDLRGALTGLADDLLGARLGLLEVLLTLARRRKTLGQLLLARFDGLHDVGPDELHDRPGDQEEHHPLDDQRNG